VKDYKQDQLAKELKDEGASKTEIDQLMPIASNLRLLKTAKQPEDQSAKQGFTWFKLAKPLGFVGLGLVAGIILVTVSQAALPTSWLYPVQKFSDSVAVDIHPSYRATIMMKRAQQVNQLVANDASSKQVLATLADYTAEADSYKDSPHANYAAFEYCKSSLQQAAKAAPPNIREAISSSLSSLETT
jgi:hypothetical protein